MLTSWRRDGWLQDTRVMQREPMLPTCAMTGTGAPSVPRRTRLAGKEVLGLHFQVLYQNLTALPSFTMPVFSRLVVSFAFLGWVAGCSTAPQPTSGSQLPAAPDNAWSASDQQAAIAPAGGAVAAPSVPGTSIRAVKGVPTSAGPGSGHRISAGDVLKVNVFQAEELSSEERVNDSGAIVMPLIGPVQVAGLTTDAAERTIEAALAKDYMQDPQVDIFVSEFANMKISVGGEVKEPGVFPLNGQTTLLQAIALAGGTTDVAKQNEVIVFRQGPDAQVNAYLVDLKEIQNGSLSDPILVSNDKILVPKSGTKTVLREAWESVRWFIRPFPL